MGSSRAGTGSPSSPSATRRTWARATPGAGVKGHHLYRDGKFVKEIPATETFALDSGLVPERTYDYSVTTIDRAGNEKAPIEIDGGIDLSNIARVVDAGVEIVVAGSAIFNTPDPAGATKALKDAAAAVAS